MRSAIGDMLGKYQCKNVMEFRNALKEIIQEIILLGLSRTNFFNQAAFYGGTALRIFYGLDRFSEDLDFSLIEQQPAFDINDYIPAIRDELGAYGFELTIERKQKSMDSTIQSAFVKGGTLIHLTKIASIEPPVSGVSSGEMLRVKFEIDTDPPEGAQYESKYQLLPVPYSTRLYDKPSLFAGKLHAILCRNWQTRVKGRDFYDYIWYLSRDIPVNIFHLEKRMLQSGHLDPSETLNFQMLQSKLEERFSSVDFSQAKSDILPFIRNTNELNLWNSDFFSSITKSKLRVV